jgi:cation diffusion facilitator CzcD-associated flavoprotein CzcO
VDYKGNYVIFGVQVPKQLFEFQDYPMANVAWGDYASGEQIQSYIESYTDALKLRDSIQFNTKVTGTQQMEDGKWKIHTETKRAAGNAHDFDYLVVATGIYSGANKLSQPFLVRTYSLARSCTVTTFVMQALPRTIASWSLVAVRAALIVLLRHLGRAHPLSLCYSEQLIGPPLARLPHIIPFQYIFLSRFGTALVSAHHGTFPGGSSKVANAFRNSAVGPALMRPVFALVEKIFAFQFGLRGDLRPKWEVVPGFFNVSFVLNSDLYEARQAGKITVRMLGEIDEYGSDSTLGLKDGSSLEADMVVSATGCNQDYSILDPATREKLEV